MPDKEPLPYNEMMRYIRRFFIISLPLLLVLELFVHHHALIGIDGSLFFNAWFGFFSCVAIVVFSKLLGVLLKRGVRYYDTPAPALPNEQEGADV